MYIWLDYRRAEWQSKASQQRHNHREGSSIFLNLNSGAAHQPAPLIQID
jgi:hypothetical protein